jgi:hypothetical protein
MQESPLLLAVAVPFVLDAMFGVKVLREVFSKEEAHGDDLLNERETQSKEYNDRVPQVFTQSRISQKVFTSGWKFNLFN